MRGREMFGILKADMKNLLKLAHKRVDSFIYLYKVKISGVV
jgi:hypothetical protein